MEARRQQILRAPNRSADAVNADPTMAMMHVAQHPQIVGVMIDPREHPLPELGGKLLDVLLELYAIVVVTSVAGAFASFFHRRSAQG